MSSHYKNTLSNLLWKTSKLLLLNLLSSSSQHSLLTPTTITISVPLLGCSATFEYIRSCDRGHPCWYKILHKSPPWDTGSRAQFCDASFPVCLVLVGTGCPHMGSNGIILGLQFLCSCSAGGHGAPVDQRHTTGPRPLAPHHTNWPGTSDNKQSVVQVTSVQRGRFVLAIQHSWQRKEEHTMYRAGRVEHVILYQPSHQYCTQFVLQIIQPKIWWRTLNVECCDRLTNNWHDGQSLKSDKIKHFWGLGQEHPMQNTKYTTPQKTLYAQYNLILKMAWIPNNSKDCIVLQGIICPL